MSADILSPKEIRLTCNAAIATLEDLVNDHPDLSDEQAENSEDAISRLQAIVDALPE
jgi:hypothetical protein